RLNSDGVVTPVAGFSFVPTQSQVIIELSSVIQSLGVYSPSLALYDQDFKLLRTFSSANFDYDRNDFLNLDKLHGEVSISLPTTVAKVYALIYTTPEDIGQNTVTLHPAKAFAIAKRNEPPKIPDPVVTHKEFGEVRVSIRTSSIFDELASDSKSPSAPNVPKTEVAASTIAVQPDTKAYYHNAIKQAVEADQIPKALSLLDEAKALNIEGAQEVFVKAVNAK
ncbi:MalM family protein, partial [Vibrio sp.]|uniref:MalM family protein n=1 Tax=Vibrio sp. TaxID=678 RepID=UPI003D146326